MPAGIKSWSLITKGLWGLLILGVGGGGTGYGVSSVFTESKVGDAIQKVLKIDSGKPESSSNFDHLSSGINE
ncbi:hypothetical protein [Mycoplasma suis]|uniref:Uncharacterized protein n=2 Tax=Mycoplasma suis TaxID=57372 RepID=F0QS08_MYCSL|nr:hypothetical protein [Mycoplasma suis]ADX98278.1 hypothetical protein MSU_0753 [Mycoplasma suis str. Illinois]CBZ40793.1 hypothetical protein MSUIS_07000 [Mycoplasma suis KI3806]